LGPKAPAGPGERGGPGERSSQREARATFQSPQRDRDRGGRRGRTRPAFEEDDVATIDLARPLPQFHVEGDPAPGSSEARTAEGDRSRGERGERGEADAESAPASTESREERNAGDPSFMNVFLNVGRRDGLRVEDVQKLLVDRGGLTESDVGHIRLRDRITFVGIRKEHSERAIKGLIGAVVGDRTLNAEPARDR
ncbi:MAG TPA: DbpA RNA binding domain-containing protein, partial [Labilithrix sp.]|nr:DbpA RNA binding domain-containing protein [Labilithrix sp.]